MEKRSPFPPVFWAANIVEVLERFAYYGIYFGFGIFMQSRGFDASELGTVQGLFLLFSYYDPDHIRNFSPIDSGLKSLDRFLYCVHPVDSAAALYEVF